MELRYESDTPRAPDEALLRQARQAAEQLIARHGWQCLDRDEFARLVADALAGGVAPDAERAAVGVYSAALHAACSGAGGAARREQGYLELWRFLYAYAQRHYGDVGEDAAQLAIERTCASLPHCRMPIAFLTFALQHLRNSARALRRQSRPGEQPLDAEGDAAPPLIERLADDGPTPEELACAAERQAAVRQLGAAFMRDYPRATQQFKALWLKVVEQLDDQTIGRHLGVPVSGVHVLRSRARKRLRSDPAWRTLACDLGLGPDLQ